VKTNEPGENPPPKAEPYDLAGRVIGSAMRVHRAMGAGFLESVYRNALCLELAEAALNFEVEQELTVRYREKVVGIFRADLIVEGALLVEIKSVQALLPTHEVQLINYLTATSLETGLLLNFGQSSLQFKRKSRSAGPKVPPDLHQ